MPDGPVQGELDVWTIGAMMCCRNWWNAPVSRDQLLQAGGVTDACVGVIMEFGDGSRRPIILEWIWHVQGKRWYLESMSFGNVPLAARGVDY